MARKRNILITGGAGFLGSFLCDSYIEQGCRVWCVDNLSSGSRDNVAQLKGNPNFTFLKHDIVKALPKHVQDIKFDVILNMASPASPPHYQRLAVETLMVGSIGTQNMLELARRHKSRFFQASTSEVYGDPEVHPQPETYRGSVNPYGPRSMYDESKRYAEALIYVYRDKYKVNTAIARFFNTYGPRMDPADGRVVSNFICQALQNKPITVYGDGKQTRSFCYVDDLIAGIVALVESDVEGPINLGNPGEFTMLQLAEKVIQQINSKSKIVHLPLPGDDPTQRKPVITKAKKELGWQPRVKLDKGLVETIAYFATKI